ncbi:MAG: cell division protein FtsZ [Porphyromonadaceae bacterium]|nr:cell division protein FtsZ [Porphyromonadaceae bacterium]
MSEYNDKPQFETIERSELPAIIKVIGVGGGGGNAVENMYMTGIKDVSFVLCNTDRQAMQGTKIPRTLLLGAGRGAGGDPKVARQLAEESIDRIEELLSDNTDMVFITAGMGGGTGTGASPVIAAVARRLGILTVGIVSIPFAWEAEFKLRQALAGVEDLRKNVDALLVINNENLRKVYPDLTWLNGFKKADETLTIAAKSIAELITVKGYINLDFADVSRTLKDGGVAVMSSGYGEGEHRITKAIEDALHSPLLAADNLYNAKRILINLYLSSSADNQVVMNEFKELNEFMARFDGVKTISGITIDDSLEDRVKVTILASDFGSDTLDIEVAYPGDKEYVVLSVAQMDDNAVLELLDRTPAYNRPSDFVKQLLHHTANEKVSEESTHNGNGVILFDKTE